MDIDDEPGRDYDDAYDWWDDDPRPPKEEPDCHGCNDGGWYTPHGWRRLLAQASPIVWGRGTAWNWRPRRGAWPCPSCNSCWLDWQLSRLDRWRHKRGWIHPAFRTQAGNYDDEPPF